MRIAIVTVVMLSAAGVALLGGHVRVGASAPAQTIPSQIDPRSLSLGTALQTPRLTQVGAIAAVRASEWGGLLGHGTGITTHYGRFTGQLGSKVGGAIHYGASKDVWAITAGGYSFPSSGPYIPGAAEQPPTGYAHFLTIYVDDQTGAVIMAQESN